MSRFSLSEAQSLGWVVTHTDASGEGSGSKLAIEKHLTARGFPDTTLREYADTMGLLLERVFYQEAQLVKRGYYTNMPAVQARVEVLDPKAKPKRHRPVTRRAIPLPVF